MIYELSHEESERNIMFQANSDGSGFIIDSSKGSMVSLTKGEMKKLREILK